MMVTGVQHQDNTHLGIDLYYLNVEQTLFAFTQNYL